MSEIGKRLKLIRKQNKLTQNQLASALGVHLSHVSHIERGTRVPSEQLVKTISILFDVEENWFKYGKEPKYKTLEAMLEKKIARFGEQALLNAFYKVVLGQPFRNINNVTADSGLEDTSIPTEQGKNFDNTAPPVGENGLFTSTSGMESCPDHTNNSDPELNRMINILQTIWTAGDERLKNWASIQFDHAFREDIIEKELKKQKNLPATSAG